MSKQIRRAKKKLAHKDPLGILSPDFVRLLKKLKPQDYEQVRAATAMPYFAKHVLGIDLNEDKFGVAMSESPRRIVIGSRRSGKTEFVALDALYKMVTEPHQKIIITGPTKEHVQEIFLRVREYIQDNENLKMMVTRDVSAPYLSIQMANGSYIRGFAIGDRNRRSRGVAIRGQDADHVYIDEFAYCDYSGITGAVLPLLQTSPGTKLTMVGTPPPSEDEHWDPRRDFIIYDKFHWGPSVTQDADRRFYTDEAWSREIMGEWDGYTGS